MVDVDTTVVITAVSQIMTALGVILTALNSMSNRRKLNKVDKDVKQVSAGLAANTVMTANVSSQLTDAHQENKAKIDELTEIVKNGKT